MKRSATVLGIVAGLLAFATAATVAQTPETPRTPSRQEIIQMRRELQSRQREREAERMRTQIVEVRQITSWPQDLPRGNRSAALRVVHEMDSLRVICRLRPATGGRGIAGARVGAEERVGAVASTSANTNVNASTGTDAETNNKAATDANRGKSGPISLPLIHRGENWLMLEPGDWNIELLIGYPGQGVWESVKLPVTGLQPGRVYELVFGETVERELKRSLGVTLPARAAGVDSESDTKRTE